MPNLINNFDNYLYFKERLRENGSAVEQYSEKYLHQLSAEKLKKETQLKIIYF
jgi:hypothetical protein